jgi:polar amino acid transport system substrate-binding protein
LHEKRLERSIRSLFERAFANIEDLNHASHGTTSTAMHLPPMYNSNLEKGATVPANNLTTTWRSAISLRPRLRACLVNILAHAASMKDGTRAMPARADQMMNALEMRLPAVAVFVEPTTSLLSVKSGSRSRVNYIQYIPRVGLKKGTKMKRVLSTLFILLVLAAMLAAAGCGGEQVTIKPGKLLMMGNENIAFLEIAGGKPTGFSAELAADIAGRLGLSLEVTIKPFAELLARLESGECDIAMSAITITPERKALVDFSEPYFPSGQAILVPVGSTIAGEADLAGKSVGVLKGSTNQKEAEKIPGIKTIVEFVEKLPMFDALVAGQLDAVICDTPFAQFNAKKTGKTRIAKVLTRGEQYGIAVKKGNSALLTRINEAQEKINEDGTYDRLYKKYFGAKI